MRFFVQLYSSGPDFNVLKVKVKVATQPRPAALYNRKKWQLIGKSHWCCSANYGHPIARIKVQLDPRHAASKHTTAPINHTRPSPRKHSPDGATCTRKQTSDYSLLLIFRTRKDERLSWPSFTPISGHLSAAGRAKDKEVHRSQTDVLPLCYASCVINVGLHKYITTCWHTCHLHI